MCLKKCGLNSTDYISQRKCQGGLHYLLSCRGSNLGLAASKFPIKRIEKNTGGKKDLPLCGELVLRFFPTALGMYSESRYQAESELCGTQWPDCSMAFSCALTLKFK